MAEVAFIDVPPSAKARAAEIRMAADADGERIGALVRDAGYSVEGVDWSRVAPYWIVAEIDGEIVGCLQVCPGLPIGRLELLGLDDALPHRQRSETYLALVYRGMAMLRAQGAQIASFIVPDQLTSYLRVLKRRGCVVSGGGRMVEKRLCGSEQ